MPKTPPPDFPPLPVASLSQLEVVEMGLCFALSKCVDRYGSITNEPKAYAYLRSYAVEIFDFYLESHAESGSLVIQWSQYFKEDSVHRVITCFLKVCTAHGYSEATYRKDLEATIESHIHNLIAPALLPARELASAVPPLTIAAPKIAHQLRALRDECRMTVEEIAEGIGVSPRSVSRHLSGEDVPRRKTLRAYELLFSKNRGRTIQIKTS